MAELWPQHQPIVLPDRTMEFSFAEFLRRISFTGVNSYTLRATDDAGDGTVEGDVNATDFTGQGEPATTNTFKTITRADVVGIIHKVVLYQYVGPKDISIGIGGDRTTVADDYIAIGTADHDLLFNLTVGDPHPQYVLETAALAVFVAAGYGGIVQDTPVALGDIDAVDSDLLFNSSLITAPKGITQNFASNGLGIDEQGIWRISASIALTFVGSNSGRELRVGILNKSQGTLIGAPLTFFAGRNQDGMNISFSFMIEVGLVSVGDLFTLVIDSVADTFTGVTEISGIFEMNHVSEFQGIL